MNKKTQKDLYSSETKHIQCTCVLCDIPSNTNDNLLPITNHKKYTYQVQNKCKWNISKFITRIHLLLTEAVSEFRHSSGVMPTEHSENPTATA